METMDTAMFLQSLRGNQPLIVLAFLFVRRAMTLDELEDVTGLHNDTIRKAVQGLASKNLLHMQRGERGKQTWLPVGESFFGLPEFQNPKFSDSGPTTTTTRLEESKKISQVAVVAASQNPRFSDSETERDLNLEMCGFMGIGEPMASKISALEWVTPDFIKGHIRSLVQGETIGLAIRRIESNELPRLWEEEARGHKRRGMKDEEG